MNVREAIDGLETIEYCILLDRCNNILMEYVSESLITPEYPNVFSSEIRYTEDNVVIYYSSLDFDNERDPKYLYQYPIVSSSRVIYVYMDEFDGI